MIELSRVNLYSFMISNNQIGNNTLNDLLQTSLDLLNGIEQTYTNEQNFDSLDMLDNNLILEQSEVLERNINFLQTKSPDISDTLIEKLDSISGTSLYTSKPNYQFNAIIKVLVNWSNTTIISTNTLSDIINSILSLPSSGYRRVFLSYAYTDYLYTISLFYFLYSRGIFLYVDWMHNNQISSGKYLKHMLNNELSMCSQLLFLQSVNMEINLSGNKSIRPWCAWEIGNFFRKKRGKRNQYYVSIYYYPFNNKSNVILDGIKKLKAIRNNRLH